MKRSRVFFCPLILLLLAPCANEQPAAPSTTTADTRLTVEDQPTQREISLYFANSSLGLTAETRTVVAHSEPPLALAMVVSELLRGPRDEGLAPLFPSDTVVLSAYLLPDQVAIVDLGGKTLEEGWQTGSLNEMLAIRSAILTVTTNFPEIRSVQFLVAGSIRATIGGHVDSSKPLVPFGP